MNFRVMFSSMDFFGNIDSLERFQRRFVRLNGYKRQKNDEAINDPSSRTPLTTTHMPPIILNPLPSDVYTIGVCIMSKLASFNVTAIIKISYPSIPISRSCSTSSISIHRISYMSINYNKPCIDRISPRM